MSYVYIENNPNCSLVFDQTLNIHISFRVAVKREAAVTKEMNAKLADDKKISRKEKDERILWKKNEVLFK